MKRLSILNLLCSIANAFRNAIRKNLIDYSSMTVKGECQTSQAMGLFYELFNADEEQRAFVRLLDFINENNDHINFWVLGSRVIFHVLSKYSNCDLAFKMIITIYYNCIGSIDIPEELSITMPKITMHTRQGVSISYQPNTA